MSADLDSSGRAIWDAYQADQLDAASRALVLEAARCADTCDRLDGLVAGRRDSWAQLVFDDMGEVHLSVDKLLEVRLKHQTVLKQLYAEMRAGGLKPQEGKKSKVKDEEPEDMLAKLRREKEDRERQFG